MQYTVTSRGRPIGVTDLGFRYRPDTSRMGWFHPNAEGEKLMPVVAARAVDLRLHAEDGTVIQTEFVTITDTVELLARADFEEAIELREAWKFGEQAPDPLYDPSEDVFDEELDGFDSEPESPFDPGADDEELIFGDGFADTAGPWTPDECEPNPLMRYQIFVSLTAPGSIP